MVPRRTLLALGLTLALIHPAVAADARLEVVASFSILGDMVREIGGDRVDVTTLVGPDGDAHVYEPTPADARKVAAAEVVILNGLDFEGWLPRLVEASGYAGTLVVASTGVAPRTLVEDGHAGTDPHAWQDLSNGQLYVRNIASALADADPAGATAYRERGEAYAERLAALDAWVRAEIGRVAPAQRRVITSHDAFGYFGAAYGVAFLAPVGLSTEAEASAADVAALVRQMKADDVRAVFVENMTDPRLIEQIAREAGGSVGGVLYADALSGADGPAPTYVRMFEHNVPALVASMSGRSS